MLLNEALRQRPADLETRRQLAEALWSCGRQSDAISEYRELVQLHPRDVRLQERLAVILWTSGQHDSATRVAESALQQSPTSGEALLIKARSQAAQHELDAAAATYIRLTSAIPELLDAKLELAEVHLRRGHTVQACTLLRDVMLQSRQSPAQQAETEWKLGLAYAAADRWTEAANHLGHAIEGRSATAEDWQMLVLAKTKAGQDATESQSRAVLASAQQPSKADGSTWTSVRDQMLRPAQVDNVTAHDDVIRADFTRNAQIDSLDKSTR